MKRKIISSLVAGMLAFSAGQTALAECTAVDSATPFTAGPVNPQNGFAEYVRDSNGLALELCLDGDGATGLCFYDPAVAGNLFSQQIGFGAEAFWWLAEAGMTNQAGTFSALVVMAAEAAFAAENPAPGEQFPFTRLRLRLDVPEVGTYVVTTPYGRTEHVVGLLGAGDEVRESFDIQFATNQSNQGRVGPWLSSVGGPFTSPTAPGAEFIGDGTPRQATGSPCGSDLFKVEIVSSDGVNPPPAIDPGDSDGDLSEFSFTTDLFTIFGRKWDGRLGTPVVSDRASYDRPDAGGQVDSFATSAATDRPVAAAVAVAGGPNLPAGPQSLAGPDGAGRFFRSESLANAGTLPAHVEVVATGADTDPTRLLTPLTDVVRISKAEYNLQTGVLLVEAASSDTAGNPLLTVEEFGTSAGAGVNTGAPPLSVTVVSAKGGRDTAFVSVVNVAPPPNQAPTAVDDSATTNEDTPVTIAVTANDADPEGAALTVVAVQNAVNGSAAIQGGSVVFTPAQDFFGDASFQYQVSDGELLSGFATVLVTVQPVNDPPVAVADALSTMEDTPVTVAAASLTANDTDVENDALTVTEVGGAVNGIVVLSAGNVTFTPATNYSGPASFTYTVSDGNGGTAVRSVAVTVSPLNDAPTAVDDFANTASGTPVTINVLANDTDPEGNALAFGGLTSFPANGQVVVNANNTVTYTPNAGFSGIDVFSYQASDGSLQSNPASVFVTVAAPTGVVDLDINRMTVTSRVSLRRNQVVGITVRIANNGTLDEPRNATVTGRIGGVEVYRQTQLVRDGLGGGSTNVTFPNYIPVVTGTINWEVVVFDDDPDLDVASATTTVNP